MIETSKELYLSRLALSTFYLFNDLWLRSKVAPEGLKPGECKRKLGRSRPPILYIPEMDVIQEAIDSSANMLKLTMPHKVELLVLVWSKGL